jgi:hypothetical protein
MGHKVDWGGQDEAIGRDKLLVKNLHAVFNDTFARPETTVASEARRDFQVLEQNLLHFCPFTLCPS